MVKHLKIGIWIMVLIGVSLSANADEVTRQQIKGLDEQVQEIKSDVLGISAELNQLEEKLLYPSNTQISLFVSLPKGETFRLDAVKIALDSKQLAHHIYTFKELEALQKGGVQRIYTGNVRFGSHPLQVSVIGKTSTGADVQLTDNFAVQKGIGPKIVEISLTEQNIKLKE